MGRVRNVILGAVHLSLERCPMGHVLTFSSHETQHIPHPFRSIPCRALRRHLLRPLPSPYGLSHMTTLLILCGMAMLALGVLVLGIALISRQPLPPPPEPPDDYSEGKAKP